MRDWSRVIAAASAGAVALLVAMLGWWWLWPRATLTGVASRMASGQFRAAEAQLRAYLGSYPEDEKARLFLAKVLVDRPEPDPDGALGLIAGIKPDDPQRAASILAIEGDACFWQRRYDRAEAAWLEALRLQPTIPEVGFKLLNIYAAQLRTDDSRELALRLFEVEPDERDRVQLLLQLLRPDGPPDRGRGLGP